MHNMEQLMANHSSLKYLELHAHGCADLLDGQRWQTITSHLITFNFDFTQLYYPDVQNLDSFRSSFWLNEKQWFVAYTHGTLFSVPYFAETNTNEEFQIPVLSTLPDITIFHKCITELALSEPVVDINYRFTEVETLIIFHRIPLPYIEQIVDLNRIQHLILCSITNHSGIMFLVNGMPNLYRISIENKVECFLEEVSGKSFEKIRNLEIGDYYTNNDNDDDDDDNYTIEQIYFVFPYVQHLHVAHLCPNVQILNFINQFKQLSTASFRCTPWHANVGNMNEHISKTQSTLKQSQSLQKFDFTYRFDQLSVHIWI